MRQEDPTLTDEIATLGLMRTAGQARRMIPAFLMLYDYVGYRDIWNRRTWGDASSPRSFDDYWRDAWRWSGP